MWLAQHAAISIIVATLSHASMRVPFKSLVFGMLLANLIDIDHAFDVGSDNGYANSLTLHIFHIYSGLIASIFYLIALKFSHQRYLFLGLCYGLIFHLGADAIGAFLHYRIDYLFGISVILLLLLWYVVNKFMNKRYCIVIWFSVFIYSLIDFFQMYINYFVFSNAYNYTAWSWIVAVILLLIYCLIFRYVLISSIEENVNIEA
ncbi:hypothetical protein [Legionella sainthelensi]|uniref:hypothetical protein n=1 Tax=Legionella sainthelensi TaxID=28087 RepID=UPI000E201BB1|nr:hypothetical protein [Legionella sainthelensi]